MKKYKIGILGATGIVGQRMIDLLKEHKLFEITHIFASSKRSGQNFSEIDWVIGEDKPKLNLKLNSVNEAIQFANKIDFFFSALPSNIAEDIEKKLRKNGAKIISNASAHRMDKDVPLLVPEILDNLNNVKYLLKEQKNKYGGFILTNPNCSTIGLVLSIYPIIKDYGVKKIFINTMQAISGAGKRGLYAYDAFSNIIPNIQGEEEKIIKEFPKITGLDPRIIVRTNRVPIVDGHSFTIFLETEKGLPTESKIKSLYKDFSTAYDFPILEKKFYSVYDEDNMPQVRRVAWNNKGLSTSVGRFNKLSNNEIILSSVSNNISRGAAGGTILIAELVANLKLNLN